MFNANQELDGTIVPPQGGTANIGTPLRPINDIQAKTLTASGAVAVGGTLTVTGAVTASGGITGSANQLPSTAGPTSGALGVADSGKLCIGVVDAVYTLPAPTAGVWYTIVTGVASAGTGLVITATSTLIQGKTTSAGTTAITNATSITNSGASDVVHDYVTIRSDGTNWYVVGQSGTYAGS